MINIRLILSITVAACLTLSVRAQDDSIAHAPVPAMYYFSGSDVIGTAYS